MNSTVPFEFTKVKHVPNSDVPMAAATTTMTAAAMPAGQSSVSMPTIRVPMIPRKQMSAMIEAANQDGKRIRRRSVPTTTKMTTTNDGASKKKTNNKVNSVADVVSNTIGTRNDSGGDGGGNRIKFVAPERSRSFHDFVRLVMLYEHLTKDKRAQLHVALYAHLSAIERNFCTGNIQRRHSRDTFHAFCYGLDVNANRTRARAAAYFRELGICGIGIEHMTDLMMMKHVDAWYDFATSDSLCDLNRVSAEVIHDMLRTNTPFSGRLCRACAHALIRLGRYGLCSELGRCENPKYSPDQAASLCQLLTATTTTTAAVAAATTTATMTETQQSQSKVESIPPLSLKISTTKRKHRTAADSSPLNTNEKKKQRTALLTTSISTSGETATAADVAATYANIGPMSISPQTTTQTQVAKRQTDQPTDWFGMDISSESNDDDDANDDVSAPDNDEDFRSYSSEDEIDKHYELAADQLLHLNGKN